MTIPLNEETFEGMKAASVFTGHWQTQSRTVMKKKRNFRITVRMYQVGIDEYIEANAVMIQADTGPLVDAWEIRAGTNANRSSRAAAPGRLGSPITDGSESRLETPSTAVGH